MSDEQKTWHVVLASGDVLDVSVWETSEFRWVATVGDTDTLDHATPEGAVGEFVRGCIDSEDPIREVCPPGEPTRAEAVAAVTAERDDALAIIETMRAEHALLRSIVDGRTTPPTDAEIAAHAGSWMIVGRSLTLIASAGRAADCAYNARSLGAGWRWIALDADGRPCAWPTVTL